MTNLRPKIDVALLSELVAAEQRRWRQACATAQRVVDEFKKADWSPEGGLVRNIADVIYGSWQPEAEKMAALVSAIPSYLREKADYSSKTIKPKRRK